jgi:hypothetical protein
MASIESFNAFDTVTGPNPALAVAFAVCYLLCYMGVTGSHVSQKDQLSGQIDRLVGSSVLRGSESLCKLLRYLGKQAVEHGGEPLKEYQIATEVFGRPPDFDPQLDSTVRVQAGRLRTKLTEYYSAEGSEDPVIIELPKGSYHLELRQRAAPSRVNPPPGLDYAQVGSAPRNGSETWRIVATTLAVFLAASVIAIFWLLTNRKPATVASANEVGSAPEALRVFWKPFLAGQDEPWVIFSNAAFIGRPETGLRYYNSARDSKDLVFDHYTGVGEVLAVHNLDQVFELLRRPIRVKRGSLFSLDDAENNDLIFVGSPSENLTLTEIPGMREFIFQRVPSGSRRGDLAIVNVHPGPNEPKSVLASPANSPLTEDYGVIGLLPGSNPGRWIMILAGTTTFGTQGVVEYVCRQDSVEQLLLRLSVSKDGEVKPFEALLHVKIARGVPVSTDLIALRKRPQ